MDDWKLEPAKDLDLPLRERARSHRRENTLIESTLQFFWWKLVRSYLALGHRLRITGREHLPEEPPFVLVANHGSHLDALTLAAALPPRLRAGTFPVAAGDTFFETPAVSFFAAFVLNALPMWRRSCGRHALEGLRARLVDERCCFVLFPEGTRTRTGELSTFRPGLGMLVAGTPVPVVPCWLEGAFRAWPPQRKRPRFSKVELRIGPAATFDDLPNERDGWKEVAERVQQAVRALATTPA